MRQLLARRLGVLGLLAALVLLAPSASARIVQKTITVSMTTGTTVRVTTDTTIFSKSVTIEAADINGATVYVGDSGVTGSTNAFYSLVASQSVQLQPSVQRDQQGAEFRLSDWYCRGTTNDKAYVTYETEAVP